MIMDQSTIAILPIQSDKTAQGEKLYFLTIRGAIKSITARNMPITAAIRNMASLVSGMIKIAYPRPTANTSAAAVVVALFARGFIAVGG
jgi:hypothetical protein